MDAALSAIHLFFYLTSPLVILFFFNSPLTLRAAPPRGSFERKLSLHTPPSLFPIHGIMGPDQHAQLDGFGLTFPFPIRVAALLVAGT